MACPEILLFSLCDATPSNEVLPLPDPPRMAVKIGPRAAGFRNVVLPHGAGKAPNYGSSHYCLNMNSLWATRHLHKFSMSNSITAGVKLMEEETLLHYSASSFFPVHIGQIFHERYKVEAKFGHGGSSAVWLCRDQKYTTHLTNDGLLAN